MAGETEYELKFRIEADAVERILEHPLLREAAGNRRVERLISTYFDTPDGLLRANRFALRVREGGERTVHTLKLTRGSSVSRGEWECARDAPQPDLAWLRRTPLDHFLPHDPAVALVPHFTVDVERIAFPLDYRGTSIEIAIDQGTIRAGGRTLVVSEIELELKEGRSDAVWHLARQLVAALPMILSFSTKSERGYALADDHANEPVHKIRPKLTKGMDLAHAFEAIVEACLGILLKNVALVGSPEDGETVHRARTALRHLRAACQLFKPALRRKRLAAIEAMVKRLSRAFGEVRDRDVFQQDVFAPLAERQDVPGARALARLMDADRRHAHEDLTQALATRVFRLALLDLLVFASDGIRRSRRTERFQPMLRESLARKRAALACKIVHFGRMSAEEMHKIRKSSKMLRYDLDLVRSVRELGRSKQAKAWKSSLTILQDRLGAIHDDQAMRTHVANHVLARFARSSSGAERDKRKAVAAGVYLCFRPTDRGKHLKEARKAARRLRGAR